MMMRVQNGSATAAARLLRRLVDQDQAAKKHILLLSPTSNATVLCGWYQWLPCCQFFRRIYKWPLFALRCYATIHISKTGSQKLWLSEISRGKSFNSGSSLGETWVLTISTKYLYIFEVNQRIICKNCEKELHQNANFTDFRWNNFIFT